MVQFKKCVPRSLIKITGHPNLLMMFSKRNCAAVAASQFLTALASAHLVRYSVPVIIYLALVRFPGGLIGPTKSISHLSNARSVTYGRSGISSHREGFPTLWQISQHPQKSLASLCNVGHHNPASRIFCAVGFPAKWPPVVPECASLIIASFSCGITHLHRTSSGPNLYRCPAIRVKSTALTTNCFFCCLVKSSGSTPVVRNWIISA